MTDEADLSLKARPDKAVCRWANRDEALGAFAGFDGKTQSANHIKPLHWYVACRLVVEGGFHPDDIVPRPPFRVERHRASGALRLHYEPALGQGGERTVLGGLKTKNVDVVVAKEGIGPVLAVSCKGVTKAFRNLTNRMEETIGECTNLHITYPALVLGYLVLIRANRALPLAALAAAEEAADPGVQLEKNDLALQAGGEPVAGILRFHNALRELTGRRGIRDDVSQYEAVALGMVDMQDGALGDLLDSYPEADGALRFERFFDTLYLRYDERFVFSAPDLRRVTGRLEWAPDSPAFEALAQLDYTPRSASAAGGSSDD
jgi:hypothetical protein